MDPHKILQMMDVIGDAPGPLDMKFTAWIGLLASYRQNLITQELIEAYGPIAIGGPFKGLDLSGCPVNCLHLLGLYEQSLHQHIDDIINGGYDTLLNIGCSFGYYAVGVAMKSNRIIVAAHDIDPQAQAQCRSLAQRNKVSERVVVGGEVGWPEISERVTENTMIICDIEGAERDLLDPVFCPDLLKADLIVEMHQCKIEKTREILERRFEPSHQITFVPNQVVGGVLPEKLWDRHSIDQIIAVWEGRGEPTPWLVMKKK